MLAPVSMATVSCCDKWTRLLVLQILALLWQSLYKSVTVSFTVTPCFCCVGPLRISMCLIEVGKHNRAHIKRGKSKAQRGSSHKPVSGGIRKTIFLSLLPSSLGSLWPVGPSVSWAPRAGSTQRINGSSCMAALLPPEHEAPIMVFH